MMFHGMFHESLDFLGEHKNPQETARVYLKKIQVTSGILHGITRESVA